MYRLRSRLTWQLFFTALKSQKQKAETQSDEDQAEGQNCGIKHFAIHKLQCSLEFNYQNQRQTRG
jgi:hypothetical protein